MRPSVAYRPASGNPAATPRAQPRFTILSGLADLARPADFGDPTGCWVPFAARLRVLIVAGSISESEQPTSVLDLTAPRQYGAHPKTERFN